MSRNGIARPISLDRVNIVFEIAAVHSTIHVTDSGVYVQGTDKSLFTWKCLFTLIERLTPLFNILNKLCDSAK